MSIATLRKAIRAKGSQASVAQELGLDRQAVNQWIKRNRVPTWHKEALKHMARGKK